MTGPRVLLIRIEPTGYMLALLRALRDIWPGEIETHFIAARASQPWDFDADQIGAHLLPSGKRAAMAAMRKMITRDPPALVHAAGWGMPACRAAILSANASKIPVVVDHDTWKDAATGIKALVKRAVLPTMLRRVTHFAPGGQRQAAFLRRYGVPDSRITPINMTVDVTAIQRHLAENPDARAAFRQRFDLPENAPIVLFLARLVPGKGISDLLTAWSDLSTALPDVHLVIVGDGPLMPEVRAQDPDRMHLLGRLSGPDVWDAYAAADVFVSPSHGEGWGLTINEAMAAGLPIVMTDAFGCIGDLAIADQTVCIARTGEPDHLHACLEKVLTDENYRTRLRTNASRVISSWTIEEEARRITGIWKMLLTSPGQA